MDITETTEASEKSTLMTQFSTNSATSTLVQTSLTGVFVTDASGTGIFNISYMTPSSNNPESAAQAGTPQYIYVWEVDNGSEIYSSAPIATIAISSANSSGATTTAQISRTLDKTYIVGYCYGSLDLANNVSPIAATLTFEPGENSGTPNTPTLSVPVIIGSSSVFSSVSTPQGNNPHMYHNWSGLALGSSITNDGKQTWIQVQACDQSMTNNNATVYLEGVPFTTNQTYTFAFGYQGPAGSPTVGMYYIFTAESSS